VSREEFIALNHKTVPFSGSLKTSFQYDEITYTLGRIVLNPAAGALTTSIAWTVDEVDYLADGIVIRSGVNLVQQYDTKLPSLLAINKNGHEDITDISQLELYIILEFDEYFRGL